MEYFGVNLDLRLLFTHFEITKTLKDYKLGSLKEEREERMIKKVFAEIIHPKTNIDDPIVFLYSFPVQIEVEGMNICYH